MKILMTSYYQNLSIQFKVFLRNSIMILFFSGRLRIGTTPPVKYSIRLNFFGIGSGMGGGLTVELFLYLGAT